MHSSKSAERSMRLVAIDLGSNSFHLVVAEYTQGQLQLLHKFRQRTVMASGLSEQLLLNDEAIERGLRCITEFSDFLDGTAPTLVRALGTNTLRVARNSQQFTDQAEAILGHPVETICGTEEARLIYLGASQAMVSPEQRQLVIDIGGGSTELIVGEAGTPLLLNSLPLGCVVYRHRFFADNKITDQHFTRAYTAALAELLPVREQYLCHGWQAVLGTSGTAHTATLVLHAMGLSPENSITKAGLMQLRAQLIALGSLDAVALPGLEPERATILPAGVAILLALFDAFAIQSMDYVEGALREGILHDLLQRGTEADARQHTVIHLRKHCQQPAAQGEATAATATALFTQVAKNWGLNAEHRLFLNWAAMLHEIGRVVAHHQHHLHGAYILQNSELAGFSLQEQRLLAFLLGAQKGQPDISTLPLSQQQPFLKLALLLRLAILLHTPRQPMPKPLLAHADGNTLTLQFPTHEHQQMWHFLLEEEVDAFATLGITIISG